MMPDWRPFLAVVPARGGSKRLPGKNIKPFYGIPLLAHSILYAKALDLPCVVSTEDEQIAKIAREYGADVIERPQELAEDDTPTWPVTEHALKGAEAKHCTVYGSVLLLQPTSPVRYLDDFKKLKELAGDGPGAATTTDNKINGNLYLWRRDIVLSRQVGGMKVLEIPDWRHFDIDTQEDFTRAEVAVQSGSVNMPWLTHTCRDA